MEAVAKQRQVAVERKKINRHGGLVWSEMSYVILPGVYLLFQDMALPWVMGTFGCPRWHWTPQFSQLNWGPVNCDFGIPKKSKSQRESPDREVLSGIAESLLPGDWIKRNDLPRCPVCLCLRRVRALWSVLHLVCSSVLCRGFNLNVLQLVVSLSLGWGAEEIVPYHYWLTKICRER